MRTTETIANCDEIAGAPDAGALAFAVRDQHRLAEAEAIAAAA